MSRPKDSRKKVDVSHPAAPLQHNPFAVLGELDALKDLPKPEPPEKEQGAASCSLREPGQQVVRATQIVKNSRGRLILRRETKDRGGKVVVVVSGFGELPGANSVMIANLARELKGKLGCGGSFDRREIVLQGDRCAAVCSLLEELGFRVDGVKE
ncbi:MAG TPA: translation initiation factor [Candidatus Methylacidiphilales bacterium]|jgi:translation initiation factor 1|nr:translation initiation factor [Candidatus Methylacidiphilales bacterium]